MNKKRLKLYSLIVLFCSLILAIHFGAGTYCDGLTDDTATVAANTYSVAADTYTAAPVSPAPPPPALINPVQDAPAPSSITASNFKTWYVSDLDSARLEVAAFLNEQTQTAANTPATAVPAVSAPNVAPPAVDVPRNPEPSDISALTDEPASPADAPPADSNQAEASSTVDTQDTQLSSTAGLQSAPGDSTTVEPVQADVTAAQTTGDSMAIEPTAPVQADATAAQTASDSTALEPVQTGATAAQAAQAAGGAPALTNTYASNTTFTEASLLRLQTIYNQTSGVTGDSQRLLACAQLVQAVNSLVLQAEPNAPANPNTTLAEIDFYVFVPNSATNDPDNSDDPANYALKKVVSGSLLSQISNGQTGLSTSFDNLEADQVLALSDMKSALGDAYGSLFMTGYSVNINITASSLTLNADATQNIYQVYAMANSIGNSNGIMALAGGLGLPGVNDAPTRGQISVISFTQAKTNYLGGVALDAAGKVWVWGFNNYGNLGTDNSNVAAYAGGMTRVDYFVRNNINVVQIVGGYSSNYAIDSNGKVYAWGRGIEGQMGNGTTTATNPTPGLVALPGDVKFTKVICSTEAASCVYAIGTNIAGGEAVYAWGYADGYRIPGQSGYVSTPVEMTAFENIPIADMIMGNQHGLILDTSGLVWSWGYNNAGQLGLGSGAPSYNTVPTLLSSFSGKTVTDISAQFNTSGAVTSDGTAWQWGQTYFGTSAGTTTYQSPNGPISYQTGGVPADGAAGRLNAPQAVQFDLTSTNPSSMSSNTTLTQYPAAPEAYKIISGRYVSYIIDVYGRVWYWGWNTMYGAATDGPLSSAGVTSPNNVGKLNNYITNATLLRTPGDGDTEDNADDTLAKGPVFSGATTTTAFDLQFQSYAYWGQWTPFVAGLHPTIYDKKYDVTTPGANPATNMQDRYLLDNQNRRIVYMVRRSATTPYTYSGNYYVVNDSYTGPWIIDNRSSSAMPAGVTTTTSTPAILQDEQSWISLSVDLVDNTFDFTGKTPFKDLPHIADISTYQSQTLFIDNSSNLYKQSLDGSGSIAWGWDYSPYEMGGNTGNISYNGTNGTFGPFTWGSSYGATAGNNATMGLYNFYNYEIMYMRGAPTIPPIDVSMDKPTSKIYKGVTTPAINQVTAHITVPAAYVSRQLNLSFSDNVTKINYLIIPYNPSDPNFNIGAPTAAQFNAVAATGSYITGDALTPYVNVNGPITSLAAASSVDVPITDVGDNCRVWVLVEDHAYTLTRDAIFTYTATNFYTPMELYEKGLDKDNTASVLYDNQNQVEKVWPTQYDSTVYGTDTTNYSDMNRATYGMALDANGVPIVYPAFGYDQVTVTYENLEPGYELSPTMPDNTTPQPDSYAYTLDPDYVTAHPGALSADAATARAANTTIFYYDIVYTPYALPDTGGSGTTPYLLISLGILILAGIGSKRILHIHCRRF